MLFDQFDKAVSAWPGARLDIKWGADRIYVVGDKMFASAGSLEDPFPAYAFKASDMAFELLVEQGIAIPAPYLARAKWVKLKRHDALPDEELLAYVRQSYDLVVARLPTRLRP